MGAFKRTAEKFKQAFGVKAGADKEWKPTSNARNNEMVKEAKKFAQHLKKLHKDVSQWTRTMDAGLLTIKEVLEAPLPRAYTETVMGVEPIDPEEHLVGQHVNSSALPLAVEEMKAKLQEEVLGPLEQWLSAYRTVKEHNKKVDVLRLDLDTKRRAALELSAKFSKLQSKEHPDSEATLHKAQTEEDKMKRLIQRYADSETEVFNALITLIRDTTVLREYAAAALFIMQNLFKTSLNAFDLQSAIRMPMLPPAAISDVRPPAHQSSMVPYSAAGLHGPIIASPSLMQGARSMRASLGPGGSGGGGFSAGGATSIRATSAGGTSLYGAGAEGSASVRLNHSAPENPFASAAGPSGSMPPQAGGGNPFSLPAPAFPQGTQASSEPPSWYNEAKSKAKAPVHGDDSDDDNPFGPSKK